MMTMEPLRIDNGITSLGGHSPAANVAVPFPGLCSPFPSPGDGDRQEPVLRSFCFALLEVKVISKSFNSTGWFQMRTRVSLLLMPVLSSNEF